jgi:hypothetical protein
MDSDKIAVSDPAEQSAAGRRLKVGAGYLIAAVCLVWVVYHVHPKLLWRGIRLRACP